MDITEILTLIVCLPLLLMMNVLIYILLAVILREEFGKNIWPFNKEENE